MKKNGQKQRPAARHFGLQLRALLDREGRKYRWVCANTGINWMRLQRMFRGSEPSLNESQELANLLGLTIEDMTRLDQIERVQNSKRTDHIHA